LIGQCSKLVSDVPRVVTGLVSRLVSLSHKRNEKRVLQAGCHEADTVRKQQATDDFLPNEHSTQPLGEGLREEDEQERGKRRSQRSVSRWWTQDPLAEMDTKQLPTAVYPFASAQHW
jgi:hypothetical protein